MRFSIVFSFCLYFACSASGQYTLNGGALNNGGNCFSITPNSSWQLGSVWNNSLLDLSTDFDIQFSMNLGTQDGNGADGIVFVLQQQGLNAIGSSGSGLGFQGLTPSLGIEFDTFQNNIPSDPMNNSNDPFADHCAIFKNGIVNHSSANQLAGPVNISASNVNIEDGLNHNVRIVWNAMQQNLQVFIDCTLRLDLTHNLVSNIFNGNSNVYWGFTGSTGGLFNNQTVCLPQNIIGEINLPLVCQGSAVNLSAPTNAYTNLNWEPANLVATPNATNTTAIINGYTEFQLTFEDICGITYAYTYIADITPGIEIELPPDSALCFGESLELNAIILGNYTNFNWYGTVGTSLSPNNSLSPTINGAGTYQLFVEGVNGCNYNESFTLTNLPTPSVQWPAITEFCPGDTLVITPEINAQFWSWQNGSTDSSFSAFETQTLTLSMATGNCTVSSTLDITELIPIQLDLGPDQVHCEGEIIELTSPIAGLWNGGSFGTNFAVAATSTIIFSGTDQSCPVIDTLLITFELPPLIDLGPDTLLCPNEVLLLQTSTSVNWNNTTTSNQFTVTEPGVYVASFNNGICFIEDEIAVEFAPQLVEFLPETIERCSGESLLIDGFQNAGTTYQWNTGETNPLLIITASGDYSLNTSNFCESISETISVNFIECSHSLWVPNSFTPNNDGTNDTWSPVFSEMISLDIRIYDRWGTIIFRGNESNYIWTGNVRDGDHLAQPGIYTYAIRYATNFDLVEEIFGHIALIR